MNLILSFTFVLLAVVHIRAMIGSSTKLNKLVDHLVNIGVVKSQKVNYVMRKVDRGEFCHGSGCYDDAPYPINYNATISAPHMHAYALVRQCLIIVYEGVAKR